MLFSIRLFIAAVVLCGTVQAQVIPPIDEGANDRSFSAFRAKVLDAVARKDRSFILSILSENILNSFGGDGGISEFRSMWQFDEEDSKFWVEFETVLRMGGAFHKQDEFIAPYVSAKWPSSLDPYEYVAVIGTKVNVRSGPSTTAPIITKLSHEAVRLEMAGQHSTSWVKVQLADGTAGYISARYVRGPTDFRAGFLRKDDRWVLRFFAAGD